MTELRQITARQAAKFVCDWPCKCTDSTNLNIVVAFSWAKMILLPMLYDQNVMSIKKLHLIEVRLVLTGLWQYWVALWTLDHGSIPFGFVKGMEFLYM
jgi:hypothetical protein